MTAYDRPTIAFVAGAAALAAAQVALAVATAGLGHAQATTVAAVAPLILLILVPGLGLVAGARALTRVAPSTLALSALVAAGLVMRLLWLGSAPVIEDDYHRYLLDGALLANGFDPYRRAPAELLAGAGLPDALRALVADGAHHVRRINFPELRSIYPGGAQVAFALAHLIDPWGLDGLRLVFLAGEVATFAGLVALLRHLGRSPLLASLYWLNPLVPLVLLNGAHVDALVPAFIVWALVAAVRGRLVAAGALIAAAASVKLWPMLLLPLILRPLLGDPRRMAAALGTAGVILGAALAPLALAGLGPSSGLTAYAGAWLNNNAPFTWVSWALLTASGGADLAQHGLRLALACTGGAVALWRAWRPFDGPEDLVRSAAIVAAATFYLSPAQFPWYVVWFLPLAAALGWLPLVLPSATIALYWLFFPFSAAGRGETFQYAVAVLHALPVFAWLLIDRIRRREA